jgi:membrane associated rhomboid family serine protease
LLCRRRADGRELAPRKKSVEKPLHADYVQHVMLENRDYMRADPSPGSPSRFQWTACVVLMLTITVAFALQQVNRVYIHAPADDYLALTTDGLRQGFLWQLLTFQFLHAGLWHLFCNLIGLWFFGRPVEARLGPKRFLLLYFGAGVVGGLLQSLVAFSFPAYFGSSVYGASAGVCGVLAAFCMMEPESQILIYFILPIRAKHLLMAATAIALFFTVVPSGGGVAHAAHLGGILTGIACIHWGGEFRVFGWRPLQARQRKRELVRAASIRGRPWRQSPITSDSETPSDEFISKEVDPILDKISAHGIQSLTERERKILEAARQKMAKR